MVEERRIHKEKKRDIMLFDRAMGITNEFLTIVTTGKLLSHNELIDA